MGVARVCYNSYIDKVQENHNPLKEYIGIVNHIFSINNPIGRKLIADALISLISFGKYKNYIFSNILPTNSLSVQSIYGLLSLVWKNTDIIRNETYVECGTQLSIISEFILSLIHGGIVYKYHIDALAELSTTNILMNTLTMAGQKDLKIFVLKLYELIGNAVILERLQEVIDPGLDNNSEI